MQITTSYATLSPKLNSCPKAPPTPFGDFAITTKLSSNQETTLRQLARDAGYGVSQNGSWQITHNIFSGITQDDDGLKEKLNKKLGLKLATQSQAD
jgi:hypothetical protein